MSRYGAEGFWSQVDKSSNCWIWNGYVEANGYGRFGSSWAHRRAYQMEVGAIPDGHQIDHLCRNRRCVRPDHLESVSHQENLRRAKALISACPKGHAYDDANTYINRRGGRVCRACNRSRSAA